MMGLFDKKTDRQKKAHKEAGRHRRVANEIEKYFPNRSDLGERYMEAARDYVTSREPKKAIECYRKAAWEYGRMSQKAADRVAYLDEVSKGKSWSPQSKYEDYLESKANIGNFMKLSSKAKINAERLEKLLRGEWNPLNKSLAAAAIISLAISIFLLSPNLTGNVIIGSSAKATSFLGGGLLIIGLVAGFFWLRNRRLTELIKAN